MNKLDNDFWSFFNYVRGRKDIRELVISIFFLKHANDEYFFNLLKEAFFSLEKENNHLKNTLSL
jgi:hypothetical protein